MKVGAGSENKKQKTKNKKGSSTGLASGLLQGNKTLLEGDFNVLGRRTFEGDKTGFEAAKSIQRQHIRQAVLVRSECESYRRTMSVVYFLNYVAGKSSCADAAAAEANGIKESEATVSSNLAIRRLCADGGGAAKQLLLPGATPEHRAEVRSSPFAALHRR